MGKITGVRGTPVNHIGPSAGSSSIAPGRPAGMTETVAPGYASEKRGYKGDGQGGTPYQSDPGNPGQASREADGTGRYGIVRDAAGVDHNDPQSSVGSGVVLNGANSYARGFEPPAQPTMDSPVPGHAARFETDFIPTEDAKHMGSGNEEGTADLLKAGGVMSR